MLLDDAFVKDSLLHVEPKADFAIFCGLRIPQVQWRRYGRARRGVGDELLQLSTPNWCRRCDARHARRSDRMLAIAMRGRVAMVRAGTPVAARSASRQRAKMFGYLRNVQLTLDVPAPVVVGGVLFVAGLTKGGHPGWGVGGVLVLYPLRPL